jgi:hypothetical protein
VDHDESAVSSSPAIATAPDIDRGPQDVEVNLWVDEQAPTDATRVFRGGLLVSSWGVAIDDAFDLLRRTSQNLNIKLRDVADHVVRTGHLPNKLP